MRAFVLTTFLLFQTGYAISEESDFKYESKISSFFGHFQNNEIDKAIDSIYRSNPYLKTNSKQIEGLKKAIKTGWRIQSFFIEEVLF